MQIKEQLILPGIEAKSNGARVRFNPQPAKRPKPVKTRFHRNGEISIRVNGHWFHGVELDQRFYLSLPGSIRRTVMRRIVKMECDDGCSRIAGTPVLASTNGH